MTKYELTLAGRLTFRLISLVTILFLLGGGVQAKSNLKVSRITFEGNKQISEKELLSILKSQKNKEFNPRFIKLDEILIRNYYQLHGFLDVQVRGTFTRNGNDINITYQINEGRRYYLKEIRFTGNELLSEEQLRKSIHLDDNAVFEQQKIDEGLNTIENYYLNHGKPYVFFNQNKVITDDSLITLNIFIQEGVTVRIAEIVFIGVEQVKRFLLFREMEIKEGDLYSREKIEISQKNLYATGLFKAVNYGVVPLPNDPSRVKLVWNLVEKKPIWMGVRFGVSYENGEYTGNVTTFDVTLEGGHRNLFGTARSISFHVVPSFYFGKTVNESRRKFSNPRNEYSLTYIEPRIFGTRTPGIFNISTSRESPPITREEIKILSTSFQVNHKFQNAWSYTGLLSFQKVSTPSDSILNVVSQGRDLIYALSLNPVKDKRDNILVPQHGYLMEFRNRFVYSESPAREDGKRITIHNTFYKFIVQWARYQPFTFKRKWTLASRLRFGGIIEVDGRNPIQKIPITERFYLGGASTIRGYQEQAIGGRDSQDLPLGGKYVLLMNAELRIPLIWILMGELFVDSGNLWQEFSDISHFSLKVSSGLGLAILTPFGPIRFDYGVKWFPETVDGKRESRDEFHIGISFAF
ncbi:MAG: hypothetical protein D6748_04080 [Calditrichaeota bacterium]|nr:MAG: hypothetical protein D6748_04080 [Calditrichota bacterium]